MTPLDWTIVLLYFSAVVGLGFWYRRRAAKDLEAYFLAGRRLHWSLLAASGSVSNFDITGTMWMVSMLVLLGMQSWWHHWMWGVMLPAFALAFVGPWVRRSGVLTGAEWMNTRFGTGRAGQLARLAYALMAIITHAALIGYAFQGIGKFARVYVPLEELAPHLPPALAQLVTTHEHHTLAVLVFGLTTLYVVLGGLFSVVVTDVVQTVVLTGAGALIAIIAWAELSPEVVAEQVPADFASLWPRWTLDGAEQVDAGFQMFGLLVVVWVLKGLLMNAGGPAQLYDFQRFLAAKSPRDAAKMAALWPFFLVVRWAMVAGIALLAITGVAEIGGDPEQVMPIVLRDYLPAGVRGVVLAGLLAAFMSTFSSTVNSGASYVVRDLWQPLLSPGTDERRLVRASYVATVGIVVVGVAIGTQADSIRTIWNWTMMALGAGVVVPNVLRWYWWRLNGWGYAAGTLAGILLSLLALLFPDLPFYVVFPTICVASLLGSVLVSWATAPTERGVLEAFYATVRPFGLWGPVRCGVPETLGDGPEGSLPRVALNLCVAIAGITCLYLGPMYLVGHWYGRGATCLGVATLAVTVLYWSWYRPLARAPS